MTINQRVLLFSLLSTCLRSVAQSQGKKRLHFCSRWPDFSHRIIVFVMVITHLKTFIRSNLLPYTFKIQDKIDLKQYVCLLYFNFNSEATFLLVKFSYLRFVLLIWNIIAHQIIKAVKWVTLHFIWSGCQYCISYLILSGPSFAWSSCLMFPVHCLNIRHTNICLYYKKRLKTQMTQSGSV